MLSLLPNQLMSFNRSILLFLMILTFSRSNAQIDSAVHTLQQIPSRYFNQIDNKIDKYSKRITGKTEKTLTKLSRWENKVKILLLKVSPESANRLFAPGIPTFNYVLLKFKEGQTITENYKAGYDNYRDKLSTSLKYLTDQKEHLDSNIIRKAMTTSGKMNQLQDEVSESEAVDQFMKERKKQLINESIKYLGKSKYLQKINKEAFYYTETLRNYKEIFSDNKKVEETALNLLNKIPAFQKFVKNNSMLASLFRTPSDYGTPQSLAGLQTRASVNALIQDRIAAGGPNAREVFSQNLQAAQAELTKLKDKIIKAGGSSDTEIPDFKPNMQKTKTFLQRLEYGFNLQFSKNNSYLPGSTDMGLSIGYKLNDKSLVGIGASYKLGLGRIDKINLSSEGIGFRSFMDWKLKKEFYVSGGFEMNYTSAFKKILQLREATAWQQAGLLGFSKKINLKNKLMKGGKVQLLYDLLWRQHVPVNKQFNFRIGYQL